MDKHKTELARILYNALRYTGGLQVYSPEGDQQYLDITIDEPNFTDHTEWRINLEDCT